jgi:hypothetical protein
MVRATEHATPTPMAAPNDKGAPPRPAEYGAEVEVAVKVGANMSRMFGKDMRVGAVLQAEATSAVKFACVDISCSVSEVEELVLHYLVRSADNLFAMIGGLFGEKIGPCGELICVAGCVEGQYRPSTEDGCEDERNELENTVHEFAPGENPDSEILFLRLGMGGRSVLSLRGEETRRVYWTFNKFFRNRRRCRCVAHSNVSHDLVTSPWTREDWGGLHPVRRKYNCSGLGRK